MGEQKKNSGVGSFAVVTGASSGIGFHLAKEFATHGFDVMMVADSAKIDEAARQLAGLGGRVEPVQVDLASTRGVDELYARIRATGRPVDAIALNAGVGVGGDFMRQTSWADELNLINLNIISTTYLAKLVGRDMVARNAGRMLFTGSIVSSTAAPFQAVYAASKAYDLSLGEALRNELKDTNVTVTVLQPGATDTNFFRRADMMDTRVGVSDMKDDPADVARDGFEALMAGRDTVVAGSLMNKAIDAANRVLPETAKAAMQRKLAEPGSANKE